MHGDAGFAVQVRGRIQPCRAGSGKIGLSEVERQAPGAAFLRRSGRSGSGFQPAMTIMPLSSAQLAALVERAKAKTLPGLPPPGRNRMGHPVLFDHC